MNQKLAPLGLAVMTSLLSFSVGFAHAGEKPPTPMTPELAAKREMVRKQQKQRVTHDQRKSAADALKAERIKIYKARQAAQGPAPAANENK